MPYAREQRSPVLTIACWSGGFIATFLIFAILARHGVLRSDVEQPEPAPKSQEQPSAPSPSNPASSPSNVSSTQSPTESPDGFGGFSNYSTGRTWNAAPDSAKHDLCARLAANSHHGNSSAFFYDGLNSLFDTNDPKILEITLDNACTLIDAGSEALPRSMRNY